MDTLAGRAAPIVIDGSRAVKRGLAHAPLWELYSFWGQCVLFGIVISVFLLQAVQQYNPQEACRMLAKETISRSAFREIEAHLAVQP